MATPTTDWRTFPCPGSAPRWRYLDTGEIEIEGEGPIRQAFPSAVSKWAPFVFASAAKYGLQPNWLAAIMAVESGGKENSCAHLSDGTCATNEGIGLMAMTLGTGGRMAGRNVSAAELLTDNALNIDLGAKYLRQNLDAVATGGDFPGGDFVHAALSYNAGRVRCGHGGVWRPPGSDLPKLPCPDTSWNVVMGCVESPAGSGHIVVNDYPRRAIAWANAALDHGFSLQGAPPGQGVPLPAMPVAGAAAGLLLVLLAAGVVGYWASDRYLVGS